jgi:hypothetical protein
MNKKDTARNARLLPNDEPRYIRCYDNGGETADRYTVVYTGHYTHKTGGEHWYLGMNAIPFSPIGIGMHESSRTQIDYPSYVHLGKRIKFKDLPEDCKTCVLQAYVYLWDLKEHPLYREH